MGIKNSSSSHTLCTIPPLKKIQFLSLTCWWILFPISLLFLLMSYLCSVVSPRNTRCYWLAPLCRTLWRNSSVFFISWNLLSSPLRLNSSETLEISKPRNRCEIYTCWHAQAHICTHLSVFLVVHICSFHRYFTAVTEQIFFFFLLHRFRSCRPSWNPWCYEGLKKMLRRTWHLNRRLSLRLLWIVNIQCELWG